LKRVYGAENAFDAQIIRDYLEQQGIAAAVHGNMLTGAIGELPMDTRPSVWIEDPDLYERARDLIRRFESARPEGEQWTCRHCGETNEPTFEICWACARDRETQAG
jgi:hypothetical protein